MRSPLEQITTEMIRAAALAGAYRALAPEVQDAPHAVAGLMRMADKWHEKAVEHLNEFLFQWDGGEI